MSTSATLAALNRAWFAACERWGITPPLDEAGELTEPAGAAA